MFVDVEPAPHVPNAHTHMLSSAAQLDRLCSTSHWGPSLHILHHAPTLCQLD